MNRDILLYLSRQLPDEAKEVINTNIREFEVKKAELDREVKFKIKHQILFVILGRKMGRFIQRHYCSGQKDVYDYDANDRLHPRYWSSKKHIRRHQLGD